MFNFIDSVINKTFEDVNVDSFSFAYEAKKCINGNTTDEASFISGSLVRSARAFVLETCCVSTLPESFVSEDFEKYTALVVHTNEFMKKIEEIANMIAHYEDWKDSVDVY